MKNIRKILFFGLGSIGKRHLRLLNKNYNFKCYAFRMINEGSIPGIINIYNIQEALETNPDIAFITNPTSMHIDTAITCLKAGIKYLFIEKPLSNSLDNLDIFIEELKRAGGIAYVGYSMRYNPILKKLKRITEENLKNIFYVKTINSSYLPNWRSGIDYKKNYSSIKEKGGGVILDLIHEFDYNEWFFGKIKVINGIYGNISNLEINSEDFCDANVIFENNIIGSIHLNYFGLDYQRNIRIFTPDEEIIGDLIKNEIIYKNTQKIEKESFQFERDDYFQDQIKYFIDAIENNDKSIDNISEAKELIEKLINFKKEKKEIVNSNIFKKLNTLN